MDMKDVKCGNCKFASQDNTPICINEDSYNYENEIGENDFCIMGFESGVK